MLRNLGRSNSTPGNSLEFNLNSIQNRMIHPKKAKSCLRSWIHLREVDNKLYGLIWHRDRSRLWYIVIQLFLYTTKRLSRTKVGQGYKGFCRSIGIWSKIAKSSGKGTRKKIAQMTGVRTLIWYGAGWGFKDEANCMCILAPSVFY